MVPSSLVQSQRVQFSQTHLGTMTSSFHNRIIWPNLNLKHLNAPISHFSPTRLPVWPDRSLMPVFPFVCVRVCKRDLQNSLTVMRIHFVDVKAAYQLKELASESASATQRALIWIKALWIIDFHLLGSHPVSLVSLLHAITSFSLFFSFLHAL